MIHDPSPRRRSPDSGSRPGAAFLFALVGFLLAYTTWAWAGLRPSFHWVGVAASGVLLAGLFIGGRSAAWRAASRDPVFWLGLAFLGFLSLQWMNAGREQYFDVGYQRWMYTAPPWPGWPSAYSRADALQMLTWFFPAWTIAVAIRSRIMDSHGLRRLLMFIVCNAGALAIFGLVQFASGTRAIYWTHPLSSHFFASFAYGNHAAPYFVLTGALAAGLLYREVFDSRSSHADTPSASRLRHPGRVAVLALALLLCLVGANLGFSRAGVILAWMLGFFVAGFGAALGWRVLKPAGRVNFIALTLAVTGSLFFVVAGVGEKGIQSEFTLHVAEPDEVRTLWERVDLELGWRPRFAWAAVSIWREHPWFGAGGWGYKYRIADHVPESLWKHLQARGWANVHFDFLQFLAEFGVVGFGLLLGALGVMAREMCPRRRACGALGLMGLVGLSLVVVFSVIDLPFRCPAILYTWVALLAALPVVCEAHSLGAASTGGRNVRACGFASRTSETQGAFPERTGP